MPVQPRADLVSLPDYVAGRTVPGAIKLSSNEVPDGPLPSVATAIAEATTNVNRYPDASVGKLAARLAAKVDLPVERIAVGCGSVSLCHQLMHAMCEPGEEVVYAWRSFETYPIASQIALATQVKVPLDAEHAHDLDAMADAVTPNTRVVLVCNPNNPTGTAKRRAELDRFLDRIPSSVLVVLDEAYREFVSDPEVPDGLDYVRARDNVAVLRTFSKAYGLAGLRVGYFVGPAEVAAAIRKVYVPFSVNSLAQIAAMASLDAEDELLARCETIVAERDRVRAELIEAGYDVPDSQANFVWLPLGDAALDFAEHTLTKKVVVRAFAGDGVRVTISHPEENDLFLHAARSYRNRS
ncbi:histidinol-phosphate aminotransferase [Amycolatopsis bartoniae]|uniref:Aromatic amino acid aminotransferase n=1 Tax=Amycolatopsis bartoniae TaxID=941986 RepID=A0A8H9ITU3_9PSEU|nr:histidinol-phosphate transaminase [Amycolatopsis bartoniae]MBB2933453.1 histidinol-phosphate aminotransferase [Amycolatopsis bartoniae]TVT00412.1 histidinol-phosphate transaminase [Amycolatopsis bartoniae]GHF59561.1 putative phenylalanine aminotransferase [Amycolatopsis bartoniae]